MAEGECFLSGDETVCHYTHESGHEDGHDALHGEEPLDLGAKPGHPEVTAERGEIGSPGRILQYKHQDKPEFKLIVFHYSML